ncbi:transcriptional regulator, LacI family [Beutenbergia cavernae DSM 12333]|uniref:Transcriptional regulator, LacI family n=1 Tax=Beutenbergia cavernae (strain ATCC BAA-8 / DSM 12333 / CCUG 43141 / JCM 11478 / NBRC 16432 / NCIMB 13614 / HKI 0122) TaxID=471853 RepID=C5BZB4_BEUC1|nr:LacI family DNA-binding transcriptional regulator [Beutenbergia cavernae]ACQ79086.1 transcriptional regulator, LacI family [Beutenbergia cavernae DSM 12333]
MTAHGATSADVARRAGVSRTAVSLVLNGRGEGNISAENIERIHAAARDLGYRRNSAAVNLRRRSTATIGIVTDEITTSPFAGQLLQGAREVAFDRGYLTIVADYGLDDAREREMVRALRGRQVDGFVHAAMSMREVAPDPEMAELPTVLANCFAPGGPAGVIADEEDGGYLAARCVFERGHRRVVMLAGRTPQEAEYIPATARRVAGFERAAREAGAGEARVVDAGWQIGIGAEHATALLSLPEHERPTAFVCARDRVAVGVVLAAARLGLRVPEDVSVVGYDDESEVAAVMSPPLTTVDLPHRRIGERAMELLLDALAGDAPLPTADVLVACELVVRESVGPAPTR